MTTKTTHDYVLSKKLWGNLQPFIYRKEARQRVILYLIAAGYSVGDLVVMKIKALKNIVMQTEISVSRDEAMHGLKDSDYAFSHSNGDRIRRNYFYRLLRYAGESATGEPMSQETFREYLNNAR